jgi:hypothetical protein
MLAATTCHRMIRVLLSNRPADAKQRDKLSPPQSITLSARASSVVGISSPSFFAVLRLMLSSNLVGWILGFHLAWYL